MADEVADIRCARCGTGVECCAFCDEPGCSKVVCYRCVAIALEQRISEPPPYAAEISKI